MAAAKGVKMEFDLAEEIEESRLLLADAAEAVALDTRKVAGNSYKIFSFATLGYLVVNAVSRRTPGPLHFALFHLDKHTELFHHLAGLL